MRDHALGISAELLEVRCVLTPKGPPALQKASEKAAGEA